MYSFPPEQWLMYSQISDGTPAWDYLFARQNINLLFLSKASQAPLIKAVEASSEWCKQYHDPYAVIFARCAFLP
jgi:hypothetical protein